jgi:hypothetical protein
MASHLCRSPPESSREPHRTCFTSGDVLTQGDTLHKEEA